MQKRIKVSGNFALKNADFHFLLSFHSFIIFANLQMEKRIMDPSCPSIHLLIFSNYGVDLNLFWRESLLDSKAGQS